MCGVRGVECAVCAGGSPPGRGLAIALRVLITELKRAALSTVGARPVSRYLCFSAYTECCLVHNSVGEGFQWCSKVF